MCEKKFTNYKKIGKLSIWFFFQSFQILRHFDKDYKYY